MNPITTAADLAHIIQLSVAPVFLLAGIAGFLNVMSSRLGRIVDRSRVVESRVITLKKQTFIDQAEIELAILLRRVHVINKAIGLCTAAALMVCVLIVSLFIDGFGKFSLGIVIASLFTSSMVLLIMALLLFLAEVRMGTQTMRVAREFPDEHLK